MFLEVKAASTSVERTLGSAGGTKFGHIIFVIIESGMMLLVVQVVRTVFWAREESIYGPVSLTCVAIGEMFNVIL